MEIRIPALFKTSEPEKLQPNLIIPFFKDNPSICVASAIQIYIHRTHELRKERPYSFPLRKPHHALAKDTLSRWIKTVLGQSGIDITIFSAQSTGHASTLADKRGGVNIDMIRKTAGWSTKSPTFARFCDRELIMDKSSFAKAVFSGSSKGK